MRVAVQDRADSADIWVYDLARQTLTRVTSNESIRRLVWAPDGKRIAYGSQQGNDHNVFWINADGSGEEQLTAGDGMQLPYSFSPDGRLLAYYGPGPRASDPKGIWIVPLAGERKPQFFRPGAVPEFSPDGHWIAYSLCGGGSCQLYVAPYPGPGEQQQVSVDSGWESRWSPDGREILWASDGKVMAVSVTPAGSTLKLGKPQFLFEGNFDDVTPDGKKFLMAKPIPSPPVTQINVVLNWTEDLKRASSTNLKP
jgi:Tol biopolymer transport system component